MVERHHVIQDPTSPDQSDRVVQCDDVLGGFSRFDRDTMYRWQTAPVQTPSRVRAGRRRSAV
jgi:hypothetical protein